MKPDGRSATISVHVQPRAKRSEVTGKHGDAIKIKLRAPPVDGAANDELIRLLATSLGLSRGDIELVGGRTSRRKHVRVNGLDVAAVYSRLGLT